jgi:hypothetical protein
MGQAVTETSTVVSLGEPLGIVLNVLLLLLVTAFVLTAIILVSEIVKERNTKKPLGKYALSAFIFYIVSAVYFAPVAAAILIFTYALFHDTGTPIAVYLVFFLFFIPGLLSGIAAFRYAAARRIGAVIKHLRITRIILLISPLIIYFFISFLLGLFGINISLMPPSLN